MSNSIRGAHVSPGVYSTEKEFQVSTKTLGITTLGVAGETLRGRAFEPTLVENWRDYETNFGGTSTEKFKDTQYPKYELPYIAKSYLSESNQLVVCRVLGLSGYNAGPAWVIKLEGEGKYKDSALAVLRSRGYYQQYYKPTSEDPANEPCGCGANIKYDYQRFYVGEGIAAECKASGNNGDETDTYTTRQFDLSGVSLATYKPINSAGDECDGYYIGSGTQCSTADCVTCCAADNFGKFNIQIKLSPEFHDQTKEYDYIYSVSLNPSDKDYILKVLGTNNDNGTAPLYVESLYDVALEQGINSGEITGVSNKLATYTPAYMSDYCKIAPVTDLMNKQQNALVKKDVGKRFLAGNYAVSENIVCADLDEDGRLKYTDGDNFDVKKVQPGRVYQVKQYTKKNGKRVYLYTETIDILDNLTSVNLEEEGAKPEFTYFDCKVSEFNAANGIDKGHHSGVVFVYADNLYYRLVTDGMGVQDTVPVTVDLNNYKTQYRCASTPWIVSNVKGDYDNLEVNRLFRFHTISDGTTSNYEVKVSIENILPDEGCFDVVVRDINDKDEMTMPVEKFSRCTLVPGDSRYIGFKIGTNDGTYESKSNYITVEIAGDGVIEQNSVPAGFLGYPHGFNKGYMVVGKNEAMAPVLMYNCNYDEDVKAAKQYFGLSSITGVDVDAFTFKGVNAYVEAQDYLSNGFHLDCRLNPESYEKDNSPKITVDGEEGFVFDTTSVDATTNMLENAPIIGAESEMLGSIFENSKLRKFTLYFCGGFDGWDVYRRERTNSDNFKITKYNGTYSDASGEGYSFDKLKEPDVFGLNQNGITSDWYAFLAAYRQFANPEAVDINIFATPGIDLINNKLLAQEVISMIETERGDSIYVATLPDKPSGASDYVDEMYTPDDIVGELEDTDIDSNYTCTYYPWVKYFDSTNNQYIYLPVTRDVVRNMAMTDNQSYAWFPPAGLDRGDVQGVRTHYVTKLADEDVLYAGRINPVKSFAQEGIKIWGQKNLQIEEGQLNRIAVRRLLLRMKRLISKACLSLIFTPNDTQTKQSLQGLITPIMDNFRSNRALSDYRIEINSSSDVASIDRKELQVRILFKPYSSLEYVSIEFGVTDSSVNFDDI